MTARDFFVAAIGDLDIPDGALIYQDRFDLINRAVETTAATFYGLLSKHYLTEYEIDIVDGRGDLSGLPIMRGGKEVNITLMSDALRQKVLRSVSLEALGAWNPTTYQNRNNAVFSLVGEQLYVAFGANLETTGCLVLWYPRLPLPITEDTDEVDLPNGAPTELGIFRLKRLVLERLGMRQENPKDEARQLVRDLYDQVGVMVDNRQLEKEVKTLL